MIDYDYINKLSTEDKIYLAKFTGEHYGASINVNESTGKPSKGSIHTKKSQVKEARDRNNRRNNDVFGVTKANNLLSPIIRNESGYSVDQYRTNFNLEEDALIAMIDAKYDPESETFLEEELLPVRPKKRSP